MGRDCFVDSPGPPGRTQAKRQYPRSIQRGALSVEHGVSVAGAAQRFAAAEHPLLLLGGMGGGWDAAPDSGRALWTVSEGGWTRGEPDRGDYRQSECEECRKRGREVDPSGYDAGKQVKGKKRHVLVDTLGLVLQALVTPAHVQDRDGGQLLITSLGERFPLLAKLFADRAYQGPQFAQALASVRPQLQLEIVMRRDQAKGFVVLPK